MTASPLGKLAIKIRMWFQHDNAPAHNDRVLETQAVFQN